MCFSIEKAKKLFFLEIQKASCKDHNSENNNRYICTIENCPQLILCEDCKVQGKNHNHPKEDLSLINITQLLQSIQSTLKDKINSPHDYSILFKYQNNFFRELNRFCQEKNLRTFVKNYLSLRVALINRFEEILQTKVQFQSALITNPIELDFDTNSYKTHKIIWIERPIPYSIHENVKERLNLEKLIEKSLGGI